MKAKNGRNCDLGNFLKFNKKIAKIQMGSNESFICGINLLQLL
jgi:hypothetical protein